jgi:hypothetical protein
MQSNFSRLPRDLMVKEHARVVERLDLASRLLNAQGEIIDQLRSENADLTILIDEMAEIKRELYKLEC